MKKKYQYFLLNFPLSIILLFASLSILIVGCHNKSSSPFSKSAEDAMSTFKLAPGFKIELVASEPLLNDPVAMTVDEYGRMYVVEMPGMPSNKSGIGKVILLSDTNGDGKMDSSTVFADSLILPTGVMRWKNGVIVTDPPNVYYMEDTNADGKADIRKTMLTGFDTSNLEANVNNPMYGLDNWIYLAVLPVVKGKGIHYEGDTSINLPESSVRFRPDQHLLESLSGKTQFGQTFDQWGNHLMVNNSNHIYQEVIASRYLERNPDLVVSNATQTLADHSEVFPTTKNPEYQMLTNIGVFTSACGISAYLGGAFPEKYNTNVTFVAEPVSNLIHVDHLQPDGVSFKANTMFDHKDFLTSTDPFCRLVNTYVGPDGALYVVDFYRQVIEGPEFMSEEVLKKVNLYNGTGTGRIYRISASDATPAEWTKGLTLGDATDEQLVEKLTDKNIWWRNNAQRLLVDRKSDKIVPSLIKMAQNTTAPMGRLHALWTLQGMNQLTPELIRVALKDELPGIRENAIQLAESHLDKDPALVPALIALQDDSDAKVRFQLLCTMGFVNTPEANEVRQHLLFKDISDRWVQIAALSASSSQSVTLLNAVLAKYDSSVPSYASLIQLLSSIIGKSQDSKVIDQFLQKALQSTTVGEGNWQPSLIEGLAQGLGNRTSMPAGIANEQHLLIAASLENPSGSIRKGALDVLRVIGLPASSQTNAAIAKALQIAGDESLSPFMRVSSIDFMALRNPGANASFFKKLINPRNSLPVQLAALKTLGKIPGEDITQYLLQQWTSLSPDLRKEAIDAFIGSAPRVKLLLDAIESGVVKRAEINWPQSVRLRSGGEYMERSRTLLSRQDGKRKDVIEQYQPALALKGNKEKGMSVYQLNCALCHQVRGKFGRAFGPDLGTVHAWASADIMTNILDPNKSIAHGYDMWIVKLNNGKEVQGIIQAETPTAITVNNTDGSATSIARQDISSLTALGMSAMPNELEKKIDMQQMADLLAYLKQLE
jgi:putative membrane-bound dehydrogenase-like protein